VSSVERRPAFTVHLRSCLAGMLLVCLLAACGAREPGLPVLPTEAVILAFGDSLTRGTGAPAGMGYPEVLAEISDREVINAGVPGELSDAGLERLAATLDRFQPDLLLLCHGGNDILRKQDVGRLRSNLTTMIALARDRGIAVLLVGVPRPGLFLDTAEVYREVATATATPLEPSALAEILSNAELKSDAVHPNAAGYRRLAELIGDRLAVLGAL
jgi:acyl-CoA thioesterase I